MMPSLSIATFVAALAFLYWQSSRPGLLGSSISPSNEISSGLHILAWGGLTLLGLWAAHENFAGTSSGRRLLAVAIVCTAYGVFDEWHQSFVPGRGAAPVDVLADAAGVLLIVLAAHALERVRRHGHL